MDSGEYDSRVARHNLFGPVAVMGVEIPNGNSLCAIFQSVERSNRDVVKITKSHRAISSRVMSGWSHQTESALSAQGRARRPDGRAGGLHRVLVDVGINRCVEIEIIGGLCNSLDMRRRMRAQQRCLVRRGWLAPFPTRMSIFQQRRGAFNSLRTLRMPWRGIIETMRIVENDHRTGKVRRRARSCNHKIDKSRRRVDKRTGSADGARRKFEPAENRCSMARRSS